MGLASLDPPYVGVEAIDGLLEAVPADEPHGVVGPALAVVAQAVDRHDGAPFLSRLCGRDLGRNPSTAAER
jgi:hypothetical protein